MKRSLFLIIFILTGQAMFAQSVLKLRTGLGHYMALGGTPYEAEQPFDNLNSNGLIHFGSRKAFWLTDNIDYPFWLEYEHNQNWGFSAGLILNNWAMIHQYYNIPSVIDNPNGDFIGYSFSRNLVTGTPLRKIPLQFSVRLFRFGSLPERIVANEKSFFVQTDLVLGGALWFRRGPNISRQEGYWTRDILDEEEVEDGMGGIYTIRVVAPRFPKYSGALSVGINFSFRTRKHEYAKLHLSYEQGLRPVGGIFLPYEYTKEGKTYKYNGPYSFTRGSNLSVRLTFPVFTYNFTKKKFYRD
jgi:hypothetical protein